MKNVLVNGGSRGIGRAIVELFSERGYNVAFTYNNSINEANELSRKTGALAIKADSALESEVNIAVATVEEKIGRVDILINNAAISGSGLFTEVSYEEWRRMFAVNLDGAFLYSKRVLPEMIREHSGRIINISSMWGITGASCEVNYSATKAAIIGMTKALAKEVGPSGITVNCIAPGLINTDMNKNLSEDDIASLVDETPLSRIGQPRDVAEAALFLAGESSSFITGEVLNVNGGFLI